MAKQKKIKVWNKQSLADIAIQESGNITAWIPLAVANGRSITDDLEIGEHLILIDEPVHKEIVQLFKDREIKPATAFTNPKEIELPSGINYMSIETDFIVT